VTYSDLRTARAAGEAGRRTSPPRVGRLAGHPGIGRESNPGRVCRPGRRTWGRTNLLRAGLPWAAGTPGRAGPRPRAGACGAAARS